MTVMGWTTNGWKQQRTAAKGWRRTWVENFETAVAAKMWQRENGKCCRHREIEMETSQVRGVWGLLGSQRRHNWGDGGSRGSRVEGQKPDHMNKYDNSMTGGRMGEGGSRGELPLEWDTWRRNREGGRFCHRDPVGWQSIPCDHPIPNIRRPVPLP